MQWGQIATATASYGYGLSVNALHLVRAYSAIANDGLMPALRLTSEAAAHPPQRAISATTARELRRMLEAVATRDGTARRAAIPGYLVAGKTGTVRKVAATGGYDSERHQSVFIGMVPAEHPRLVGLVMIDEPSAGDYYGGVVAAPVFSAVLQGALRLLQIAPDACTHDCPPPVRPEQLAMPGTRDVASLEPQT
jgi:cell division protein FtsI (penicillin-binding protein 3)